MSSESLSFNWSCKHTWKRSAKNTAWCLLGCSIGDFGTILFFQLTKIPFPVLGIMTLAIINGLITSIILETVILMKQNFDFKKAFNHYLKKTNGAKLHSKNVIFSYLLLETIFEGNYPHQNFQYLY